jgi:hypothetical protein
MTAQFFRLLVVACGLVPLSACFVGVSRTRYSSASIDDPAVPARHVRGVPVDRMFLLKDMALYVYPNNEEDAGDTLLFPIPVHTSVPHSKARPFIVGVGLRPNRPGFVVNPAEVRLTLGASASVIPTRIRSAAECSATKPGVTWGTSPMGPFLLPQGVCTSFAVEFEVTTPDPREEFSIEIGGVTRDGIAYALPTVHFQQKRRLDPFGAP